MSKDREKREREYKDGSLKVVQNAAIAVVVTIVTVITVSLITLI
jgi:hypothetical protein